MASDRPSNQKSSINILSGNAKTQGGDQQFIQSWAAPITDNGLGQLAQGFGQAAAGVTQLAAAYQQRKVENEDTVARLAAIKASDELLRAEDELLNTPVNGLNPDTLSSDWDKSYVTRAAEIRKLNREGLKTPLQQKIYDTTVASAEVSGSNRVRANATQKAMQLNTASILDTMGQLDSSITEHAAAGRTAAIIQTASMSRATLDTWTNKLDPLSKQRVMQGVDEKLIPQVTLSVMQAIRNAPAETVEQELENQKSMVMKAASVFGANPAALNSLLGTIDSAGKAIIKERTALAVGAASDGLNTALGNFKELRLTEAPVKIAPEILLKMPKDDQYNYVAMQALAPMRNQFANLASGALPESQAAVIVEQAKNAANALPPEVRPAALSIIEGWSTELVARTTSPEGRVAAVRANGGTAQQQFQQATIAAGGDVGKGIAATIGEDTLGAALNNLSSTLQQGGRDVGSQAYAQVQQAMGLFNGISVAGAPTAWVAAGTLFNKAPNAGTRRVIAVSGLLDGAAPEIINAMTQAAYRGASASAASKGWEKADAQANRVRELVAASPEMRAITERLKLMPAGTVPLEQVAYMREAIAATVISTMPEGKFDERQVAAALPRVLGLATESMFKDNTGQPLVRAERAAMTGQFTTERALVPEKYKTQVASAGFRKALLERVTPLIAIGKNPANITGTALETSPSGEGLMVVYENPFKIKTPFADAKGNAVVIKWADIPSMVAKGDAALAKTKAANKVSATQPVANKALFQLGLSDEQIAKNRAAHNAMVARNKAKK